MIITDPLVQVLALTSLALTSFIGCVLLVLALTWLIGKAFDKIVFQLNVQKEFVKFYLERNKDNEGDR